jgi:hypothetical protein
LAQLEYGDYYKFIVSCDIGLLLVAIGLPWLFLRKPFDLLVEVSKLNSMTPLARDVVLHRQWLVAGIIRFIPYASSASGIAGFGLSLIGWRKRQGVRDRKEDVTLSTLPSTLTVQSISVSQ